MPDFDMQGSLWDQEIIDQWGYAQEIDRRDLSLEKISDAAGRAARNVAMTELISEADISPEIIGRLYDLSSRYFLKLNGRRTRNVREFVEALNGNDTVFALYIEEDNNEKSLVSRIDLSTSDVPLIDDSNGSDYKLYGVYASQEEAEGDIN